MRTQDDILAGAAVAQLDDGRDRYLGRGLHRQLIVSFLFHVTRCLRKLGALAPW